MDADQDGSPTIEVLLRAATARLAASAAFGGDRDAARFDAELLLADALATSRARLRAHPERVATAAERAAYARLVERRADGEPVAYLRGVREFRDLELEVDAAVLVPRPETELLVEWTLELLQRSPAGVVESRAVAVLDLGTGSGALGLAIAHERPGTEVDLVDTSAAALAVAARNAARHGLDRVRLLHGDWYGAVAGRRYDLVVANPPYLALDDPHLLGPGLAHEPRTALVAGPTGLEDLERVAAGAYTHLCAGGWLLVEHGATQGAAVRALLVAHGLVDVATRRDLAGLERATGGRRHDAAGAGHEAPPAGPRA